MAEKEAKEEEGQEQSGPFDACLTSATAKTGLGLVGGFLGSMIVRRRWPIILGAGFGVGQSIGACRDEFSVEKDDDENEKKEGKELKDDKKKKDEKKEDEKKEDEKKENNDKDKKKEKGKETDENGNKNK